MPKSVIVIGGGIIGLNIAEKLISQGHDVTLIEKEKIAAGASYGNAAGLAFSDIMPLASPGIIKKAIKWFLDPLGPFAVVPQDLPKTLGWLLKFLKATSATQFEASIKTQAGLMHLGKRTFPEMLERTGLSHMVRTNGALHVYESEASFQADLKNWEYRRQNGIDFEVYQGDSLHQLQPGLSRKFVAGILATSWQSVSNPNALCQSLQDVLKGRGCRFIFNSVSDVKEGMVSFEDGTDLQADNIVIAAGPWSSEFSRKLGDAIPLIGERGYNTTLPKTVFSELDRTLVFSDHGFVITPLCDGVRVGGASEIAKLNRPPNYRRSRMMLDKAKRFVPSLDGHEGTEWMGARPSIPDTLPVIGPSSKSGNIIYAFGHGHLGLTQSTATAQLVSELISGQTSSIDLYPLRASRF